MSQQKDAVSATGSGDGGGQPGFFDDHAGEDLGRLAHDTMREWAAGRVAQGFNSRWRDTPWEDLPEPTRMAYRVVALAVARAVREAPCGP